MTKENKITIAVVLSPMLMIMFGYFILYKFLGLPDILVALGCIFTEAGILTTYAIHKGVKSEDIF